MLLKRYHKEMYDPASHPYFESIHCIAFLDEDIGDALPYLNSVLGGDIYIKDPPSVTFKAYGRLITVHAKKIAMNALRDEAEADRILEWLKQQINNAWENRSSITPRFEGARKPHILEIYKLLPGTNCRECGQPTCMMFASLATEGAKESKDCPKLSGENAAKLQHYLGRFNFDKK